MCGELPLIAPYAAGTADVVDGFGGAALWLPPGVDTDAERLTAVMQEHAERAILPDMMRVFGMDRFHPKDPVWYLPLIAVDPAAQNQGSPAKPVHDPLPSRFTIPCQAGSRSRRGEAGVHDHDHLGQPK